VGEHLLVRGRWLSVPKITSALSRIDGISHWELRVSREGTLDKAVLQVTFKRDTLVKNPMWKGRISQALVALNPVSIEVAVVPEASEEVRPPAVTDLRGHHLGRNRTEV
jgi:phenylacetate-CoA ligase